MLFKKILNSVTLCFNFCLSCDIFYSPHHFFPNHGLGIQCLAPTKALVFCNPSSRIFVRSLSQGRRAAMVVQAVDNCPRHNPNTRYSHSIATHPPNIVVLLSFSRGMQVDRIPGLASALVPVLNDIFVFRSEPNINNNYPKGDRKLSFIELCTHNKANT